MSDERTIQTILSERLKEVREYRGPFSQEEVARHLGVPRSAISSCAKTRIFRNRP